MHIYSFMLKYINLYKYKTRYLFISSLRVTKVARNWQELFCPWKNGNAHMPFPLRVFPKMNSKDPCLLGCMLLCHPLGLKVGWTRWQPSNKLNMAKVTLSILGLGYRKTGCHLAHWRPQASKWQNLKERPCGKALTESIQGSELGNNLLRPANTHPKELGSRFSLRWAVGWLHFCSLP